MLKAIEISERILIGAIIFLFPLFFVTSFVNIFLPAKTALLIFGVLILLSLKLIKVLLRGSLDFSTSPLDIGVFLVMGAYLLSTVFISPNKMNAFFLPGGAITVIASGIFYFLINQQKNKKFITYTLMAGGIIVSLTALVVYIQLLTSFSNVPEYFKNTNFSLTGSITSQIVFLLPILAITITSITKAEKLSQKIGLSILSVIIGFGSLVSIYSLLPVKDHQPTLPSIGTSWTIAIDVFKESPLLGVGPDNYRYAFNRFRPVDYNQTNLWNQRFNNASNFYLTVWTETGLTGLVALGLVIFLVIKNLPEKKANLLTNNSLIALFVLVLIGLVLPFNPVTIFLLFVLLALSSTITKIHIPVIPDISFIEKAKSQGYKIPLYIIIIPLLVLFGYVFFLETQLLAGEVYIAKAIQGETTKDGGATTRNMITKAIEKNNKLDSYYSYAAQADIAIANLVSKKDAKDITPQEREAISSYIVEAVELAKSAVSLNPNNSQNWELLGNIYRSVMPYAKGMDKHAIESYRQAIALDSVNPLLRIALGGVYYATGDYEKAIDAFKLAVAVKPDYPNSHYNLAIAYCENKQIDKAIEEMKIVLGLVDKDSADYTLAKKELETLESRKTVVPQIPQGDQLDGPQKNVPALDPQLELPEVANDNLEVENGNSSENPSPSPSSQPNL